MNKKKLFGIVIILRDGGPTMEVSNGNDGNDIGNKVFL